jgi:hypothetical protein
MTAGRCALVAVLVLATGCSPGVRSHSLVQAPAPAATTPAASPLTAPRFEITATVLESPRHGPQLCAGGMLLSLPPQCGGPPVEPWDWAAVTDETSAGGTTWGSAHLVGTYDGTFHLTEPPGPPARPPNAPTELAGSPCAVPHGGWRVADPARMGTGDLDATTGYAFHQPDVAGVWLSWPAGPTPGNDADYTRAVLNLAFTGDLDRHRREARERWGGALCVTQLPRALKDLRRIQDALRDGPFDLLSNGVDEPANVVEAEVLIADDAARRWVDERFGPGVVVLTGRLQPVG